MTQKDKQEVYHLILKAIDEVMIPSMEVLIDQKLEQKLDEKLDQKLDEKLRDYATRNEMINFLDPIMKELQTIREEQVAFIADQRNQDEEIVLHDRRLYRLENNLGLERIEESNA